MKNTEYKSWAEATRKHNEGLGIKVGQKVKDSLSNKGIVVKIVEGYSDTDFGAIYVWKLHRQGCGSDNCEHYPYFGWESNLRILNPE